MTASHNAVIDRWESNEKAESTDMWAAMLAVVKLAMGWYDLVAKTLLKESGLSPKERTEMTGGTFHGHVTGTKEHPLRYVGTRNYVSQAYCTRAFLFHYLHTASRFDEYRTTNPGKCVAKDYVTWLQVMYGTSTGKWCALSRSVEKTLARFNLTPAKPADRSAGRAYASAVYKDAVRDPNAAHMPGDVSKAINAMLNVSAQKRRNMASNYEYAQWKDEAIIDAVVAGIAQLVINAQAAKAAKDAKKKQKQPA